MTISPHPHGSLALVDARLVDPVAGTESRGGVLIEQGFIRQVGSNVTASSLPGQVRTIDCRGDVVAPGLVDMHAFVGEPGAEYRETIATATAAAASGGVTSILARPDTNRPSTRPPSSTF